MEPVAERPPCPRCGSTRLIGRRERVRRPRLGAGLPLRVWWRYRAQRPQGHGALLCYTYQCEVCGHQWRIYQLEPQPEQARTTANPGGPPPRAR